MVMVSLSAASAPTSDQRARLAKRTVSLSLVRMPCLCRYSTITTTSPNQEGVEEEVQRDDKPGICKGNQVEQRSIREMTQEKQASSHLHPLHISLPPAIHTRDALWLIFSRSLSLTHLLVHAYFSGLADQSVMTGARGPGKPPGWW